MKANVFLTVVSVLISALAGYGFFAANSGEDFRLLLSLGSGLCLAITLAGTLGIKLEDRAGNTNFKLVSVIFFVLLLVSNLIFAATSVKVAPYIIVCGILLLLYAVIEYGIIRHRQ